MHIDGSEVSISHPEATFIKRTCMDDHRDISNIILSGQLNWARRTVPSKYHGISFSPEFGTSKVPFMIGMATLFHEGPIDQEVIYVELSEKQLRAIRILSSNVVEEIQEDLLTVRDILYSNNPDSNDTLEELDIHRIFGEDDNEGAEELWLEAQQEVFEGDIERLNLARRVIAAIDLAIKQER